MRERLRAELGAPIAELVPGGYQRLGPVLVLRLPEALRPAQAAIARAWQEELGVASVLVRSGPASGEFRRPSLARVLGTSSEAETIEHGIHFRFDAERILFARGNRTERLRFGRLVRTGETVCDLFAGIGYFTLPALVHGGAGSVLAVEKNPLAFRYLEENLRLNGVAGRARTFLGDNREAPLPRGAADRVVLGLLPSSLPWVGLALGLLRPDGGSLHVHLVAGTRSGVPGAEAEVRSVVEREGGRVLSLEGREVKAYGPGRLHAVVDVTVGGRAEGR